MNLTTQAQQVACFANAAAHLKPGGYFVVEVMLPRLQQLPVGETTQLFAFSGEHIGSRRIRLGKPEVGVSSRALAGRRCDIYAFALPLCLAQRSGSHGPTGRHAFA